MTRKGVPHTPEHRAAIAAGIRRSNWSHRQAALARHGRVHDLVPAKEDLDLPGRPVKAGECHWCAFWGVAPRHTGRTYTP